MIVPPHNPLEAVTHPDPYPYYADLVANRPLYRDETLGVWVASSAATVTAVLNSDLCKVRPTTQPVPASLVGSSAADIFRHLIRMNDGQKHNPMKGAVSRALQSVSTARIAEEGRRAARLLAEELEPQTHHARLADFAYRMPVYVIGGLLGIPQEQLPQTALWINDFARCMTAASTPEQVELGKRAAGPLLDLLHTVLSAQEAEHSDSLLIRMVQEARRANCLDRDVVVANAIGLLWQPYEATSGLIGNTLMALAGHPHAYAAVLADPAALDAAIQEVLRYDPSIQNSSRYLADNGTVAGQEMKAGDSVLVVLAAANRDPAANAEPERFDIFRKARRLFIFGSGVHACPGEALAAMIARAGVEQLIRSGIDLSQLPAAVGYRRANIRVPLFAGGER